MRGAWSERRPEVVYQRSYAEGLRLDNAVAARTMHRVGRQRRVGLATRLKRIETFREIGGETVFRLGFVEESGEMPASNPDLKLFDQRIIGH